MSLSGQHQVLDGYRYTPTSGEAANMSTLLKIRPLNLSDDYDYDYDESISNLPLELVPVALVYCTTLLLGVLGNSLVIFSIARYRRMRTVTNIFLTSLASADLLLVMLCVPIKLAKWFTFTWEFGEVLCKVVHYMQNVSVICSVLTLTSMSVERYYAILQPMKAKFVCTIQRARKVILFVWVLSFILAVPIIIGRVHKAVGMRIKAHWCVKEWSRPAFSQVYEVGMLLLVFLIPLGIITFAYTNICLELWIMTSRRARMRAGNDPCAQEVTQGNRFRRRRGARPSSDDDKTRKQVIKMLVIVIVLFVVCWAPSLIDNVLVSFEIVEKYNYGHLKHLRQTFAVLSYFNSCVNPFVYAFMSKNFRKSFKYAVCSCLSKERFSMRREARQVSFQTGTSSILMTHSQSARCDGDLRNSHVSSKLLADTTTEPEDSGAEYETII